MNKLKKYFICCCKCQKDLGQVLVSEVLNMSAEIVGDLRLPVCKSCILENRISFKKEEIERLKGHLAKLTSDLELLLS